MSNKIIQLNEDAIKGELIQYGPYESSEHFLY